MRYCLYVMLAMIATSCCGRCVPPSGNLPGGPNITAMEQVTVTYGDELLKEKRLYLRNATVTYDQDCIWRVEMNFRTMAVMDIDEARDLVVYLVEGYLARMNEDEELAFDFPGFELGVENLKIEIEFESFYTKYGDEDCLGRIVIDKGCVHYYAHTALCGNYEEYHTRTEPYVKTLHFSKFHCYRPWLENSWADPKKRGRSQSEIDFFTLPPVEAR